MGTADLRFSGAYAEHYVQAFDGTKACTATTQPGKTVPTLTGFQLESNARSASKWQLTLEDLTDAWSMDIFFEDTADGLWWTSGVGVGSVTRTTDGFAVDVVMTDSVRSIRVRGVVICR